MKFVLGKTTWTLSPYGTFVSDQVGTQLTEQELRDMGAIEVKDKSRLHLSLTFIRVKNNLTKE